MKKKILSIILSILVLGTCMLTITACSPSTGEPTNNCEHVADGSGYCSLCNEIIGSTEGVLYELSDDESYAEVFGYEGSSKNVIIAEEYNGKPVKSIYEEAFRFSSIKSVVIPDSVTSVGNNAFSYCESLKSVTIPDSVTSIGDFAFYFCDSLTSVTIPDSVTSIGYRAFYGCRLLTSVTIGNSVTYIGDDAFSFCNSSLYTTENNLKYVKANNNPYCILVEATNKNLSTYQINSQTKYIANSVFPSCERLTQITIPDSVTSIGYEAFYDCESLTKVNYTGTIDQWAQIDFYSYASNPLYYAKNLYINDALVTEVVLTTATKISDCAFYGCESLTSVTIGNGVTSIGDWAFYYCRSLTSVTIPDSVTSIGDLAFSSCSSLTSVTIPDSVNSIGNWAFSGCDSLQYYIEGNLKYLGNTNNPYLYLAGVTSTSITNATINENCKFIGADAFEDCDSLTSVTIPDSVTSIGYYAFYDCDSLTSVTIGNSVTSIGSYAFRDCDSLTSVTIPDSVTSIGDWAFRNCNSLTSIKYCGSEDQWNSIVKGSDWNYNTGSYTIIYNYAG